jgi:mRNA interferase YafQ
MLEIRIGKKFKKDVQRMKKRGANIKLLKTTIENILMGHQLPEKYKEHPLIGQYANYKECHISPDWILIYRIKDNTVYFYRTGTHSDLFK